MYSAVCIECAADVKHWCSLFYFDKSFSHSFLICWLLLLDVLECRLISGSKIVIVYVMHVIICDVKQRKNICSLFP